MLGPNTPPVFPTKKLRLCGHVRSLGPAVNLDKSFTSLGLSFLQCKIVVLALLQAPVRPQHPTPDGWGLSGPHLQDQGTEPKTLALLSVSCIWSQDLVLGMHCCDDMPELSLPPPLPEPPVQGVGLRLLPPWVSSHAIWVGTEEGSE